LRAWIFLVLAIACELATLAKAHADGRFEAPEIAQFENMMLENALALTQQGLLAQALTQWEVLSVLRPHSREYQAERDRLRTRINELVDVRLRTAATAMANNQIEIAILDYLRVLSLDPANAKAIAELRYAEQARVRNVLARKPQLRGVKPN